MSEFNDFDRPPNEDTFQSCFDAIETCDYYILLVGGRRGSWYEEPVSVTLKEYRVALDLAWSGSINIIPFIRSEVMTVLRERKAIREDANVGIPVRSSASNTLEDPEFVDSFVDEIRSTQVSAQSTAGPVGNLWYYTFKEFSDIVDALRINLNLHQPINRLALLENLRWELYDNLDLIGEKTDNGLRFAPSWISEERNDVPVSVGTKLIEISPDSARRLAIFLLMVPDGNRMVTLALQQAFLSGEFLAYDPARQGLMRSICQEIMYRLWAEMERYRHMIGSMAESRVELIGVLSSEANNGMRTNIRDHDLAMIFGLHDRLENIVRLSTALLRYIINGQSDVVVPDLQPVTPIKTEIGRIEQAQVSSEDIDRWVSESPYGRKAHDRC